MMYKIFKALYKIFKALLGSVVATIIFCVEAAALVFGIVGTCLSFLPVDRFSPVDFVSAFFLPVVFGIGICFAFFIGLMAVGLAGFALLYKVIFGSKKSGKRMSIAGLVLGIVAMVISYYKISYYN